MVIETARKLGREVRKTEEWKNYREAKEVLEKDKELLRTIALLEEKRSKLDEKMSKGGPVEVEEKKQVRELKETLSKNEVFLQYMEAQNRYLELMGKVDRAITEGLEGKSKKSKG